MNEKFKMLPVYEEPFRRMVIEEYLATGCQKKALLAKHRIGGKGAIQRWMRLYGYQDPHTSRKQKLKFVMPIATHISMPSDSQNVRDLQKKIQELERQLLDEKLRSEAYRRIIEKAEEELKIQITKKPFTK
jgi:transposase